MLLRSSSTPVLGSLLSSIAESPNNNNHGENNPSIKHLPLNSIHHSHYNKLSFHQASSHHFSSVSCISSPISPSFSERSSHDGYGKGFRRAQSEGNLEGLANACSNNNSDELYNSHTHFKPPGGRLKWSVLQTVPSFSFCDSVVESEYEESDDEVERQEFDEGDESLESSFGDEDNVQALAGGEFSQQMNNLGLVNETNYIINGNLGYEEEMKMVSKEMYLAQGVDIYDGSISGGGGGGSGGAGGDYTSGDFGNDGNNHDTDEYFRKMLAENPGNPLFMRNYAQFLYQSKQDLKGAEEYYSRAILADPNDGEILAQYAKLIWELHRDQDRALSYFERAVHVASEDSHVHAAYASFLWETEDEDDEDEDDADTVLPHFQKAMASASA